MYRNKSDEMEFFFGGGIFIKKINFDYIFSPFV